MTVRVITKRGIVHYAKLRQGGAGRYDSLCGRIIEDDRKMSRATKDCKLCFQRFMEQGVRK